MLTRISEIITECRNFLITSHVRPDGDAIGSELALYFALRSLDKDVSIYNQNGVPDVSRYFGPPDSYDALFVLDCSDADRIGKQSEKLTAIKYVISIDHHVTGGEFSDICVLEPTASSTGELVYKLIKEINVEITKEIATNLYAAILTDTGSFHYSNTGADTLEIAGEIVRCGANPSYIAGQIFESNPPAKIRLFTKAVQTLKLEWEGRIGSIFVFRDMLRKADAKLEHTENFVDFVRTIKGVEVALFYTEMEDLSYKVSMRSKGNIDVEKIASRYGGGGHVNAAACRVTGKLEHIRDLIIKDIIEG